jgi:FG-GAP-like repeat/Bacterial Ig domain
MRSPVVLVSAFVLAVSFANAQTGFSTKTYSGVLPPTSENTQLLSADFNGDGYPDLLSYGSRITPSSVPGNIFRNSGNGGFSGPTALPGSGSLAAAAVADMNGDGYPDIVGCENEGSGQSQTVELIVWLNKGDGTFTEKTTSGGYAECNAIAVGDIFHTGHPAVVVAGYTPGQYNPGGEFFPGNSNVLNIYTNDGTGTLTEGSQSTMDLDEPNAASGASYTNCGIVDVVGADFQNNGDFDLLVTTNCQPNLKTPSPYQGTVYYLPEGSNNGTIGYWTLTYLQSEPEIYESGVLADLQNDGTPDVLYVGRETATSGTAVYARNEGNDAFTFQNEMSAPYFEGVASADFNGDGFSDLATTFDSGSGNNAPAGPPDLAILNGSGNGTFTQSQQFATGTAADLGGGIVTGDFNQNDKQDMATLVYDTSTQTTSLNVYYNTQGGTGTSCPAPGTVNTNHICTPTSGTTLNSPVTVSAASNVSGFTLNRLYLDNQSVYQTASQTVDTTITASEGSHELVLVSYDNSGKAFTSSVTFTVGNPTGSGCIPSAPGVTICSPTNGETLSSSSSFTLTAGARAQSGYITAMRVYVDNTPGYTTDNPGQTATYQFSETFGAVEGTHTIVVVAYESTGGSLTASVTYNSPEEPCSITSSGATLKICSPNSVDSVSSPVNIQAASYDNGGYMTAIRIYVDNVAVATLDNNAKSEAFNINTSVSMSAGRHYLALVGYLNSGGAATSTEYITVK